MSAFRVEQGDRTAEAVPRTSGSFSQVHGAGWAVDAVEKGGSSQIKPLPRNSPSNAKRWVGMDSGPSVSSAISALEYTAL